MTDVSLREFVSGVTLEYSARGEKHEICYRTGEGIYVDDEREPVPTDDVGARRVYWNLTGGKR